MPVPVAVVLVTLQTAGRPAVAPVAPVALPVGVRVVTLLVLLAAQLVVVVVVAVLLLPAAPELPVGSPSRSRQPLSVFR